MSATVLIYGIEATIDGYKWESENKPLKRLLNAMLDPSGPSGSDPNPDLRAAREAVSQLGGKLIDYEPTEYEARAIY